MKKNDILHEKEDDGECTPLIPIEGEEDELDKIFKKIDSHRSTGRLRVCMSSTDSPKKVLEPRCFEFDETKEDSKNALPKSVAFKKEKLIRGPTGNRLYYGRVAFSETNLPFKFSKLKLPRNASKGIVKGFKSSLEIGVRNDNEKKLGEENDDAIYGTLTIKVQDTGCGITDEEKSKLFQPFTQANKLIHSKYGGTGMGLWISSKLITSMGGKIDCQSTIGKGTTFIVSLPTQIKDSHKVTHNNNLLLA